MIVRKAIIYVRFGRSVLALAEQGTTSPRRRDRRRDALLTSTLANYLHYYTLDVQLEKNTSHSSRRLRRAASPPSGVARSRIFCRPRVSTHVVDDPRDFYLPFLINRRPSGTIIAPG